MPVGDWLSASARTPAARAEDAQEDRDHPGGFEAHSRPESNGKGQGARQYPRGHCRRNSILECQMRARTGGKPASSAILLAAPESSASLPFMKLALVIAACLL